MKVDVTAAARDFGFGMTVVISAVRASTGKPIDGLVESNFKVVVIQGPSGWSVGDDLTIDGGPFAPTAGVYAVSVTNGGKKLAPGQYTFAVIVKGTKGKLALAGQTLTSASMK